MIPKFFIHNSESPFDPELFVQPKNTREVWRNKLCGGIWLAAYTSKKSYLSHFISRKFISNPCSSVAQWWSSLS